MIRGLTKKSSHKMVEPDILKGNKRGTESKQSKCGGESDRTYPRTQKRKKQT